MECLRSAQRYAERDGPEWLCSTRWRLSWRRGLMRGRGRSCFGTRRRKRLWIGRCERRSRGRSRGNAANQPGMWLEGRGRGSRADGAPRDCHGSPEFFPGGIQGREDFLNGFRDFRQNATIQEFREHDWQVDVVGDTAVITFLYDMVYERDWLSIPRNRSRDLWVFEKRDSGAWIAVWRAMLDMEEHAAWTAPRKSIRVAEGSPRVATDQYVITPRICFWERTRSRDRTGSGQSEHFFAAFALLDGLHPGRPVRRRGRTKWSAQGCEKSNVEDHRVLAAARPATPLSWNCPPSKR